MEQIDILGNDYLLWILFGLFVGVALAIDFGVIGRTSHFLKKISVIISDIFTSDKIEGEKSSQGLENKGEGFIHNEDHIQPFRQAVLWTVVWISLAAIFAAVIYFTHGYESLLEFVTGYALEKSLSVDNMFVFLLIFSSLAIPHSYHRKVLSVGIISAIAMRIPLILVGATLLESFHWTIYVFGGMLLFTAIRMLLEKHKKTIDVEKNIAIRLLRKVVPISYDITGERFFRRINNVLYATPMFAALITIEMTDLVFAGDSIPAILAITTDPFIVITSNIFAILGLRSLYFLLAGLMGKLYYLKPGLIALIFFIGFKMLLSEFYEISVIISLVVVSLILSTAIALSLLRSWKNAQRVIK